MAEYQIPRVQNHFVIVLGLFSYRHKRLLRGQPPGYLSEFTPWFARRSPAANHAYFRFIGSYFYGNYLRSMFPELGVDSLFAVSPYPPAAQFVECMSGIDDGETAIHLSSARVGHGESYAVLDPQAETKRATGSGAYLVTFALEFADVWFMPNDIGIFALKVRLGDGRASHEAVSSLVNALRNLERPARLVPLGKPDGTGAPETSTPINLADFVNERVLAREQHPELVDDFTANPLNSKLKSIIVLESDPDEDGIPAQALEPGWVDDLLYDHGTVSPLGSSRGAGALAPSDEYRDSLLEESRLSVFANWTALCLFDTMTVLITEAESRKKTISTFSTFEDVYYPLYVSALFPKYVLFSMNHDLSRNRIEAPENQALRGEFIRFRSRFTFSHISYNFLPNMIYERIQQGMDLRREVDEMEEKVERIDTHINEKQDRTTNVLLTFLSVFAVGSAFFDTSEWLEKLLGTSPRFYPVLSLSIVGATLVATAFVVVRRARRINRRR